MVFSSTIFLFLFLPLVLVLHFLAPQRLRNGVLLLASMIYYAWGEATFLCVVLISIFGNYVFGSTLQRLGSDRARKCVLGLAVVSNIGLLLWFKYANFAVDSYDALLALFHARQGQLQLKPVALPLGVSFFTFHALSYVIDVYRRHAVAQKNPGLLLLYILFFPQLIAGPIVRYHEIAEQLSHRTVTLAGFSRGIERFVIGLGKKMLIANVAGEIADGIFGLAPRELTLGLSWLGVGSYAIQIYFDFSGYSDMAIGLARLFGFQFPENFDYPYSSQSVTEFWRRWHLTLSRWFRDYLYVPLGGNRLGTSRTYLNLVIVFALCGLWHGASWNFVIWGLLHGAFLVLERKGLLRILERAWSPVRHLYCLTIVLIGWVFFRSPNLSAAGAFLQAMAGHGSGTGLAYRPLNYLDHARLLALAAGVVGATPLFAWLGRRLPRRDSFQLALADCGKLATLLAIAVASAMRLSSGTYNPFIYFRF
ncbi:MAG TPA: MBOAT family protein [Polyangiaceae bacterium]|nr:MBOAT family protein [Polyangiaceae bacterium]